MNWLRKQKLFLTFFISFLLVLFIPGLAGLISFAYISGKMQNMAQENNRLALTQIQMAMDEKLIGFQQIVSDIGFDSDINRSLYFTQESDGGEDYRFQEVAKRFQGMIYADNVIEDVFMVLKKSNYAVDSSGLYQADVFFRNKLIYDGLSFSQWEHMLFQNYYSGKSTDLTFRTIDGAKQVIGCMYSIPIGTFNEPLGNLTILMNPDNLDKVLGNLDLADGGAFFIQESDGTVVHGIGNGEMIQKYSAAADHSTEDMILDSGNMVFQAKSQVSNWRYTLVYPMGVIRGDIHSGRMVMFVLWALGLLCSVGLAYYFARFNYKPIEQIRKGLLKHTENSAEADKGKNELEFIHSTLLSMENQYETIQEDIRVQMPVFRNALLLQILKGNIHGLNLEAAQKSYGITFPYDYYAVMVLDIYFVDESDYEEIDIIKYAIMNIMEELGNTEDRRAYLADVEKSRLAVLFNLGIDSEEAAAECAALGEQTIALMQEHFGIEIRAGQGRICEGLTEAWNSCHEAVQALEGLRFKDSGTVVSFAEESKEAYSYPLEVEQYILSGLKFGNYQAVHEWQEWVYDKNFIQKQLPGRAVECLLFELIGTVYKCLDELKIHDTDLWGDHSLYESMKVWKTPEKIHQEIQKIFLSVCDYVNANRQEAGTELLEQIREYVQKNYSNPDLNLNTTANAFRLNHSYLSHMFKEQTGENFGNYVREVKLQKAEEFLKDTAMTIDEIAERVGYSNSTVFIRNFKKVYGTTPGQYRQGLELEES